MESVHLSIDDADEDLIDDRQIYEAKFHATVEQMDAHMRQAGFYNEQRLI